MTQLTNENTAQLNWQIMFVSSLRILTTCSNEGCHVWSPSNSYASHSILTKDSPVDLEKEKRRKEGEKGGRGRWREEEKKGMRK